MPLDFNRALSIRDEIVKRFATLGSEDHQKGSIAEAAATKPSLRLQTGISPSSYSGHRVKLGIHAKTGVAAKVARQAVAEHGGNIDLRFIRSGVELPEPFRLARSQDQGTPPRPLRLGQSISHLEGLNGSIGGFVECDGEQMVLSASHVIARSGRVRNLERIEEHGIYQPGCYNDTANPSHLIGYLTQRHSPIKEAQENELDYAMGTLIEGVWDDMSNSIPRGYGFDFEGRSVKKISDPKTLERGDTVLKIGSATGVTRGVFRSLSENVPRVEVLGLREKVYFAGLVEIEWLDTPFASPGDSGGLYILEKDFSALALHVTSDSASPARFEDDGKGELKIVDEVRHFSYGCPLFRVFDHLTRNGHDVRWSG